MGVSSNKCLPDRASGQLGSQDLMYIQTAALLVDLLIALLVILAGVNRPRTPVGRSLSLLAVFTAAWLMWNLLFERLVGGELGSLLAAGIYLTAALTASVQCLYAVSLADRQHWVNRFPLAALAPVPL